MKQRLRTLDTQVLEKLRVICREPPCNGVAKYERL